MSNAKRSSVSKRTDTKTKAYRGRLRKNYVQARNPWPDPFTSSRQTQSQQTHNQKTTARSSDNSQQSRSKSGHQKKAQD